MRNNHYNIEYCREYICIENIFLCQLHKFTALVLINGREYIS